VPLYDFRCSGAHVFERRLGHSLPSVPCACGRMAERLWTSPPAVVGPTTDTRGMYRRFTEASAEIDHNATRHEQRTGQPATVPNLWQAAKQRAGAMVAAGEAPVPPTKSLET
jgi:hypothetical protein